MITFTVPEGTPEYGTYNEYERRKLPCISEECAGADQTWFRHEAEPCKNIYICGGCGAEMELIVNDAPTTYAIDTSQESEKDRQRREADEIRSWLE
jgi:hypothetical protein